MKLEEVETSFPRATEAKVVKYTKPTMKKAKSIVMLARSDVMMAAVQVVAEGGETNMHSHAGMDGLWFVLGGRARFYGKDNVLLGEFGKHEGVFIPRDVPYWFESASDEPLEILQAEAICKDVPNIRTDYAPRAAVTNDFEMIKS